MKKRAFTLIEMLIVMVLIAILALYSIPRLNRDSRSEAINHLLTMIRFTQNLALHDNRHNFNNSMWQKSFWRFEIYQCKNGGLFYKIGADKQYNGGLNRGEVAIDPSNGKFTFWDTRKECPKNSQDALMQDVSPNIFITQKYGINKVEFKNCAIYGSKPLVSNAKHVRFDFFGRAYRGYTRVSKYASLNQPRNLGVQLNNCEIEFSFIDPNIKPFTIIIPNESGFAYLKENPSL